MSASAIVHALNRMDPDTFANISRTTIEGWIDRNGPKPRWSDAVLKKVEQGNDPGHSKGGRRGILVRNQLSKKNLERLINCQAAYPNVVNTLKDRLIKLRKTGAPLTVVTARGIMLATILQMNPEILDITFKDEPMPTQKSV